MSLLSQQKPACTHDIFTFLPRCCHRKKISEYKPCPTKHRWEQALSSSLLFHFSPFLATPWGPGPLYVRLSPCFWTVPVNITHIQIGERELALQRETGQPKQGQIHTGFVPKATGTQLPEPQGSENVPAVYDNEGVNRGATLQCLRQTKSKVPQLCHLPCAGSAACAAQ